MAKMNCWEYKRCGRQPGGANAEQLGVCPAAVRVVDAGKNGGEAAGRWCWKVGGTLCDGKVQGTFAQKLTNCTRCDFFEKVKSEEGVTFQP